MIPNHKLEYIYKIIINYLFLLQSQKGYFNSAFIDTKLFTIWVAPDNYVEKLEIILTFKKIMMINGILIFYIVDET